MGVLFLRTGATEKEGRLSMPETETDERTRGEPPVTVVRGAYHGNDIELCGQARLDERGQLKAFGASDNVGWDIPTLWAIDHDGKCWANNAHGGRLFRVTVAQLAAELQHDEPALRQVHRVLGLRPMAPSWMRVALSEGWAPPDTFKREDYQW